jgi:hypothetical protein
VSPIVVSVPVSHVAGGGDVVPPLPPPQPAKIAANEITIPRQIWRWSLAARFDLLLVNIIFSFPAQACRTNSFGLSDWIRGCVKSAACHVRISSGILLHDVAFKPPYFDSPAVPSAA